MRLSIALAASALLVAHPAFAETTPLSAPLVEEKAITIACELTKTEPHSNIAVFSSAKDSEKAKGAYHYKLWLPKGYLADAQRRWPCMFIAAPGGNAAMGTMAARLASGGYVAVMLVESRNGPWEPIVGNFLAAHDDVVQRVRIQEWLKFATGMSGGARASSLFAQIRPGFSGVILQGAGFFFPDEKVFKYDMTGLRKSPGFLVAMTMGEKDSNKKEVGEVKAALPGSAKFFPLMFDGGHTWAPAELFDTALTWMEKQIYLEGPPRPELQPVYLGYFQKRHADFAALTAPWDRCKTADELLTLARARGLNAEPSIAPHLREAQAEAMKLRSDPAIAKEAMAADAWRRLEEASKGAGAAKFAADAAAFAKRYPGTEAAKKAEATAGAAK